MTKVMAIVFIVLVLLAVTLFIIFYPKECSPSQRGFEQNYLCNNHNGFKSYNQYNFTCQDNTTIEFSKECQR